MARMASVLIPSCDAPVIISALATTTASTLQTIGKNRIFAINAPTDVTILFGNKAGPALSPTGVEFRIPANNTFTFDTGQAFDSFMVYNLSTATAVNVSYQTLTVV